MAYVHMDASKRSKLDASSRKMVFIGYPRRVKGCRLWDLLEKKATISIDVVFDENSIFKRQRGMEEQQEQQEVQSDSGGQLTSYTILPFADALEGLDI